MEEGRPVGISALAGLLFAAAAAAVVLFVLLLVSGRDHPAFRMVDPEFRRLLIVALPLGSALAAGLGTGLIGLRRWAWWGAAAAAGAALAISSTVLEWKYRVWRASSAASAARDEFFAQGCWTFLFAVLAAYLLTAIVLDAFRMRPRWLPRVAVLGYVLVATASGHGFGDEIRRLTLAFLQWVSRGSLP